MAAGVSKEDSQVLFGHKSESVTDHYSVAEIMVLVEAANMALRPEANTPTLTMRRLRVA